MPNAHRPVRFWADVIRKHGFDGIDVHEAWDFESNPANMPLLGAMAEGLRGATPPGYRQRQFQNQYQ